MSFNDSILFTMLPRVFGIMQTKLPKIREYVTILNIIGGSMMVVTHKYLYDEHVKIGVRSKVSRDG